MRVAHDHPMEGHRGIRATSERILDYFFWPKLKEDVKGFVKTCDICQRVGNPNQKIPQARLYPIPVVMEPFERIQIDCVGPLNRTSSGKKYILTILDLATRYPEAIPLGSIRTRNIVKAL